MSCCEKCWAKACARYMLDPRKTKIDHYYNVMKEVQKSSKPCTLKERAGQFWDEEKQCDSRGKESRGIKL